jgi:hypothetical protein
MARFKALEIRRLTTGSGRIWGLRPSDRVAHLGMQRSESKDGVHVEGEPGKHI